MGLKLHDAAFLLSARDSGVTFERTLTLGHQEVMDDRAAILRLLEEHAARTHAPLAPEASRVLTDRFADSLLAALGAREVAVLDNSDYEGAAVIHDLNLPIPEALRRRFDVVYDGGTLEHVFNFPVAIKNAMEMVRVGGHLIVQTPANNYFGHGFYQISPELLYRVLCDENGFRLDRMVALEDVPQAPWYEVADPDVVKARVELINSQRVLLLAQAERIDDRPIFRAFPQQSDYVANWHAGPARPAAAQQSGGWRRRIRDALRSAKRRLERYSPTAASAISAAILTTRRALRRLGPKPLQRRSFTNRDFFRPVPR